MNQVNPLSVTVIGGYLGSGKTTLINHWLRRADGMRLAILVNDFGELPIDADLIESEDGDVINLSGGCVCCSYGNDLTMALVDLLELSPRPDHVVLEASGVALPGAIAASLGLIDGYRISGVVTLADSESVMDRAADKYMSDTVLRQLNDADVVVMTKTDLIATEQKQTVRHWLASQNPELPLLESNNGKVPLNLLLDTQTQYPLSHGHAHHHDNPFHSYSLVLDAPVPADKLAHLLTEPEFGIVRAKGFFYDDENRQKLLQIVGRRWEVKDAKEGSLPGLVVIGVDLIAKDELMKKVKRLREVTPKSVSAN